MEMQNKNKNKLWLKKQKEVKPKIQRPQTSKIIRNKKQLMRRIEHKVVSQKVAKEQTNPRDRTY